MIFKKNKFQFVWLVLIFCNLLGCGPDLSEEWTYSLEILNDHDGRMYPGRINEICVFELRNRRGFYSLSELNDICVFKYKISNPSKIKKILLSINRSIVREPSVTSSKTSSRSYQVVGLNTSDEVIANFHVFQIDDENFLVKTLPSIYERSNWSGFIENLQR